LAIIFTGSRSICLLSGLFIVIITLKSRQNIEKYYILLKNKKYLIIFVIIATISAFPYLFNRFDSFKDVLTDRGTLTYRKELNKYSLKLNNNSLLGIGINMTPFYLVKYFKTVEAETVIFDQAPAHNIFIQIITEEGYLGFIIFILFLYFALRKFILNPKKINKYALSSILFILAAQFHPVFTTHPEIFSFFLLYLSFSLLYKENHQ
jgi:O-antigen ligase